MIMKRKITAPIIHDGLGNQLLDAVLVLDSEGRIENIQPLQGQNLEEIEVFDGHIMPGFINAHCHLELSHMKAKVNTGTGLIPFIESVVAYRDFPEQQILEAIHKADVEMQKEGIVAVGDICNKIDTFKTKEESPIQYYSFVEMFDFLQDSLTQSTFDNYFEVFSAQSANGGNKKSCVPHAPYSVSKGLFQKINAVNKKGQTVSIHNQETPPENQLFQDKTGAFLTFYKNFKFSLDHFEPTGKSAIHYALDHMDPSCKTLFVHNTLTTVEDIQSAQGWNDQVFWATCPNANLYIENRLPNYQNFLDTQAKVCIGTDSLTSNWQLSILEEMKTIQKYQSYVALSDLVQWACINGAQALSMEEELGSIEVGKKPGINLINMDANGNLFEGSKVQKLV